MNAFLEEKSDLAIESFQTYNFYEKAIGGSLPMSEVFIAYKRADAARTAVVREKLEALGVSLFIDQHLISGENYLSAINSQLNSALAVLVLWSKASVVLPKPGEPNFLISEAQRGYARDILVAATFDRIALDNLPVPFNTYHASDLSEWLDGTTSAKHRGWQTLLEALAVKIKRPGLAELAIALEEGSDEAKRRFIRRFPSDPASARIADEIIAKERIEFDKALALAQHRVDQRKRDGEKLLKECRKNFEQQVALLRTGGEFWPPDPVNILDDNVAKLNDQVEIYEATIQDLRGRAEQAETDLASANEQNAAFSMQVSEINSRLAQAEETIAGAASLKSEFENLKADAVQKRQAALESAAEITSLKSAGAQTEKLVDEQSRELRKLASDNIALRRRLPEEALPIFTSTKFLIGSGLAAGMALGVLIFSTGSLIFGDTEAKSYVSKNDTESQVRLDAREKQLNVRQSEVDRQEKALKSKESALNARQDELASTSTSLDAIKHGLDKELENLKARKDDFDYRQTVLTNANIALTERERNLNAKETESAKAQKDATAPSRIAQDVSDLAAKCDEFAGSEFDLDRPAENKWKDDLLLGSLTQALATCEAALKAAADTRPETTRRLLVNIGRIYTSQGALQAKNRKLTDAQRSYDSALASLNRAAKLGSAHAYYILGSFYRGDGNSSPVKKDPAIAWDNFLRAAELQDPIGLTTVAFAMLLPHWTDKIAGEENLTEGRKYLEGALKSGFPRAHFVLGLAKIEGRGFPKDEAEGIKEVSYASCKDDPSAQRYIRVHHIKSPVCS